MWTGTVFTYLRYFVAGQIAQSGARFRFVVNGCPPEQIALMEEFCNSQPDRVVEVLVACDEMERHGLALDITHDVRDDGEFFCFIDPDIVARGPFVADFARRLDSGCAGVTSGRGVWRDDDVIPEDQRGVSGEYFYARDGFLFGSPHFAMYHRDALDHTLARWGVGFKSVGPEISGEARQYLRSINRQYLFYDTGKLVNIFLQDDGNSLCHFEHPNLLHIGGVSHYLSSPEGYGPEQTTWPWPVKRLEVARFTAMVLRNLCAGLPAPSVPTDVDGSIAPRLVMVRDELITLVETYQSLVGDR